MSLPGDTPLGLGPTLAVMWKFSRYLDASAELYGTLIGGHITHADARASVHLVIFGFGMAGGAQDEDMHRTLDALHGMLAEILERARNLPCDMVTNRGRQRDSPDR